MTHHDEHDHHLAEAVAASWTPAATTAQVNDRVDAIITEFEDFRTHVHLWIRQLVVIAGAGFIVALAAGIELLVTR